MRKKLLTMIASIAMACSLAAGAAISASAGVVENKPAGDGLITATNEINNTNFRIVEANDGDSAAYTISDSSAGNHVVAINTPGGMSKMTLNKGVPAATMAKGATVTLKFKFVGIDAAGSSQMQLLLIPGAKNINEITYGYVLTGGDNGMAVVPDFRPSATAEDPKSMLIAHHGGDAEFDASAGIQWQAYSWAAAGFANEIASYGNSLFKIEMTVNSNSWVDVKLVRGFVRDDVENWHPGATITNWAYYDGSHDFYTNTYLGYATGALIDDVTLTATYNENGTSKTDVICENNLDAASSVAVTSDQAISDGTFVAIGSTHVPTEPSGIVVTNPSIGSGIATRGALVVDSTLDVNFELNAKLAITAGTDANKVGIMFGLESGREIAGAHKYVYIRNTADGVKLGVESVDAEGNATALIEEVVLTGITAGDAVDLVIKGVYGNISIVAGANAEIIVENFDANGFFAITHKGEGQMSYLIKDNLTLTGYEFKGNSENATAITTNFEGNYINSNKFQQQSTITPESHMVKGDTTTKDLVGMVVEEGKLGFYGTSTNTRLLTAEKYADFVMQFDYTSVPTLQRGQITGITRQSQFYIMFGMKEGGLPLADPSVYAIGFYEGNADIGFYGANGTVVSTLGMASKCYQPQVKVGAPLIATTTPTETSIPRYGAGGYDATKENNNVIEWYDEGVGEYGLYNKTTRVKLVVVNNKVALFFAEVDTTTGEIKGEYVKFMEFDALDTEGYLGLGTDSPGWAVIDNFAITPVSREDAMKVTSTADLSATGIVADISATDMDEDQAPTPLAKPVLTIDAEAKKVTWEAIDGAKEYVVSIKNDVETVVEDTIVTATEFDISGLTAEGTYKITVKAIPTDENVNVESRGNVDYVVEAYVPEESTPEESTTTPEESTTTPEESKKEESKGGCGSAMGGAGLLALLALAGVRFAKKRD